MGDPRRIRNKYKTPNHPWEKLRLEAEKPLLKEYGLVNKKELWKITSKLKNFKDTAKKLVASKTEQSIAEKKQMVDRMKSFGLISSDVLDEILGLEIQQLLDRRLQTIVFKKGLARSIKQARQMITHKHIAVNGVKITAPGYLVKVSEEDSVIFMPGSSFVDEAHPERVVAVDNSEEVKKKPSSKKKDVVSDDKPVVEDDNKAVKAEKVEKAVDDKLVVEEPVVEDDNKAVNAEKVEKAVVSDDKADEKPVEEPEVVEDASKKTDE